MKKIIYLIYVLVIFSSLQFIVSAEPETAENVTSENITDEMVLVYAGENVTGENVTDENVTDEMILAYAQGYFDRATPQGLGAVVTIYDRALVIKTYPAPVWRDIWRTSYKPSMGYKGMDLVLTHTGEAIDDIYAKYPDRFDSTSVLIFSEDGKTLYGAISLIRTFHFNQT